MAAYHPDMDFVERSRLETHMLGNITRHVYHQSNDDQGSIRIEEDWEKADDIGRGFYGDVYLHTCVRGPRKRELRAVKKLCTAKHDVKDELHAITLFSDTKYMHRFVQSYGWYEIGSDIYIAMEYLPSGHLRSCVNSALPDKQVKLIISQVLDGVVFMHDIHMAHRDLKPENILVARQGPLWWVKLADFGISKRVRDPQGDLNTVTGTPTFVAPEVLQRLQQGSGQHPSYTIAVDLWSIGIITFWLMTCKSVFESDEAVKEYAKGKSGLPLNLLKNKGVTEPGCDFVQNLLQAQPGQRPTAYAARGCLWLQNEPNPREETRDNDDGERRRVGSTHAQPKQAIEPALSVHDENSSKSWPEAGSDERSRTSQTTPCHDDVSSKFCVKSIHMGSIGETMTPIYDLGADIHISQPCDSPGDPPTPCKSTARSLFWPIAFVSALVMISAIIGPPQNKELAIFAPAGVDIEQPTHTSPAMNMCGFAEAMFGVVPGCTQNSIDRSLLAIGPAPSRSVGAHSGSSSLFKGGDRTGSESGSSTFDIFLIFSAVTTSLLAIGPAGVDIGQPTDASFALGILSFAGWIFGNILAPPQHSIDRSLLAIGPAPSRPGGAHSGSLSLVRSRGRDRTGSESGSMTFDILLSFFAVTTIITLLAFFIKPWRKAIFGLLLFILKPWREGQVQMYPPPYNPMEDADSSLFHRCRDVFLGWTIERCGFESLRKREH